METFTIIFRTPDGYHHTRVRRALTPWAAYDIACTDSNKDPKECYFVAYIPGNISTEVFLAENG